MIDMSALLGMAPTPVATTTADGAVAVDEAFAALFDEAAAHVAATLLPFMQAPTLSTETPTLPDGELTLTLAPPDEAVADDELAALPSVLDAVTESVAIARVAFGLPMPAAPQAVAQTTAHVPVDLPTDDRVRSSPGSRPATPHTPVSEGVAVGRTGVMPTALPEHAHAAEVLPAGIARRFPAVTDAPEVPEVDAAPDLEAAADPSLDLFTAASPANVQRTSPEVAVPAAPMATEPTTEPDVAPVLGTTPEPAPTQPAQPVVKAEQPVATPTQEAVPTAAVPTEAAPAVPQPTESVQPQSSTVDAPALEALAAPIPASPQLDSAAPVRESEHIHGIARPLRAALRDADPERPTNLHLTVRLDPPELGAVRLHVVAHGDRVSVTMHADSPEAAAALNDRRNDVVELLRRDGFSLEGFDIATPDRGNGRGETPEQSRRRSETFTFDAEPEPELPQPAEDNELRL